MWTHLDHHVHSQADLGMHVAPTHRLKHWLEELGGLLVDVCRLGGRGGGGVSAEGQPRSGLHRHLCSQQAQDCFVEEGGRGGGEGRGGEGRTKGGGNKGTDGGRGGEGGTEGREGQRGGT